MPDFRLALKMLFRDLRAGELSLLGVALLLAVTSLSSVGFFADRVQQSLRRDATQLMGGDLLVSADAPLPPAWRAEAQRRGLQAANTVNFSSMVSTGELAQLSGAKFVESGYPLRGRVEIAPAMGQPGVVAGRIPAPGEAWVEERLLSALNVKVGDTLSLGNLQLRVGALITFESDRGNNFFSFIPRIMVNAADLPASGLIQEGSRVRYRLQLAGSPKAVADYERWLKPQIGAGQQLESLENVRPEIRGNLERIQHFLQLAGMLSVVLAAVAIGLSARRYLQRHLDGCAAMRCFGAQRSQLLGLFLTEFTVFGLAVALLGCALGFVVQLGIAALASSLIQTNLPLPSWLPVVHGLLVALVLVLGFIAPQLLHMTRVPPIHVLRREWGGMQGSVLGAWAAGILALLALFLWMAGDIKLGAWVALGFAAACAVFALIARLALGALGALRHRGQLFGWALPWGLRYGLAAMHRRLAASVVQSVALGLALMAMLLLGLVSGDLMRGWQRGLRPDAPNQFLLNIQTDQRDSLQAYFRTHNLPPIELLPMIRGRLVELRGQPVTPGDYPEERARNLLDREFNLSQGSVLQEGNRVVAGTWHGESRAPVFSMEEGVGKTLGIRLGDAVSFDVAGQRVSGTVGSIRKLDWDSMRVNFFFSAAPGVLDNLPTSWITSFRLPPGQGATLSALVAAFPNLTVIDVAAIIAQVQDLSARLIRVVQAVFGFALLAGAVVLWSALRATHDERAHELSVLRTLGASNAQLRAAMLSEFLVLGVLASVLACLGALATGQLLAIKVFDIEYRPDWLALVFYVWLAVLAVLALGWLGVRGLLRRTVVDTLRAGA
ncbi:ABC transporter permease [Uliginosibacterium sediminicola]|uniref:FtsX-like permease family protein n=1 Tax=Uliginosibacterium sediminicola TaxID=2024550 RepID=A0ABU9YV67_9RHOO